MTACQQASPTMGGSDSYLVTVADFGGGVFQYVWTTGTIHPSSKFKGVRIEGLTTISPNLGFRVTLDGSLASNFFSAVIVQDTAGTIRNLLTSSAAFTVGFVSQWDWTVAGGTSLVWTAAGTRILRFIP